MIQATLTMPSGRKATLHTGTVLPLAETSMRQFLKGEIWRGGPLRSASGKLNQGCYALLRIRTADAVPDNDAVESIASTFQLNINKRPCKEHAAYSLSSMCGDFLTIRISLEHNTTNYYSVSVKLTTKKLAAAEMRAINVATELFMKKESSFQDELSRDFTSELAMKGIRLP